MDAAAARRLNGRWIVVAPPGARPSPRPDPRRRTTAPADHTASASVTHDAAAAHTALSSPECRHRRAARAGRASRRCSPSATRTATRCTSSRSDHRGNGTPVSEPQTSRKRVLHLGVRGRGMRLRARGGGSSTRRSASAGAVAEPDLGEVRLVQVAGRASAAHLGRHPARVDGVRAYLGPPSRDGEREDHVVQLGVRVGLRSAPPPPYPLQIVEYDVAALVHAGAQIDQPIRADRSRRSAGTAPAR